MSVISDLPTVQRLYAEDYHNTPDWFRNEFIRTFNLFSQPVYNILNQGITFTQNFNAQVYVLAITGAVLFTNNTASFMATIAGNPTGVILVAKNVVNSPTTPIISPVEFSWYANAGTIFITGISGLTPTVSYLLTFLVF